MIDMSTNDISPYDPGPLNSPPLLKVLRSVIRQDSKLDNHILEAILDVLSILGYINHGIFAVTKLEPLQSFNNDSSPTLTSQPNRTSYTFMLEFLVLIALVDPYFPNAELIIFTSQLNTSQILIGVTSLLSSGLATIT